MSGILLRFESFMKMLASALYPSLFRLTVMVESVNKLFLSFLYR